MSTEEFRLALTFVATLAAMGAATKVILAWLRRPRSLGTLPSDLMERLERIERAVDTTALEVERIGEGQRFLTRALGDRSIIDAPRADSPGRVITPH